MDYQRRKGATGMKKVFILMILIFFALPSWGWVQSIDASKVKAISLKGFYGDVSINGVPEAKEFRLQITGMGGGASVFNRAGRNSPWKLAIKEEKGHLELSVQGPEIKGIWWDIIQSRRSKSPVRIIIHGPARKLKLSWFEGKVELKDWRAESYLSLKSGKLSVENSSAFLQASLMKGQLLVKNHGGDILLDTYRANINLSDVLGEIKMKNFSGKSLLKNNNGRVHFSGHSGVFSVRGGEGEVHFESQSGEIALDRFKGLLTGKSEEGRVTVNAVEKPNIRIRSNSGMVKVVLSRSSGSWVNVGTAKGDLYVPSSIKTKRFPNLKLARGRLPGLDKGTVYVRTQSGKIIIR